MNRINDLLCYGFPCDNFSRRESEGANHGNASNDIFDRFDSINLIP